MSAYQSPNNIYYDGPLLIDEKKLNELVDLEIHIIEILEERYEKRVENEIEEFRKRFNYNDPDIRDKVISNYSYLFNKNYQVISTDSCENKYIFNNVKDLIKSSELNDKNVIKINLQYANGRDSVEIDISRKLNFSSNIRIEDNNVRDSINYDINNFLGSFKYGNFLKVWYKKSFPIMLITSLILYIVLYAYAFSSEPIAKNQIKNEIKVLVDSGIDSNNINKAVELLLKYEIGYTNEYNKTSNDRPIKTLVVVLTLVLLLIIALNQPRTTVSIGKGKQKIKFLNYYIKFVFIIIPTAIITNLFSFYFVKIIESLK